MDEETEIKHEVNHKDDIPTSIIVRGVPLELFEDESLKKNFSDMFTQIEPNVRIDYLKGFNRVRVVFTEPEHATAAKLLIDHHAFNGVNMKAYFARNIKLIQKSYQDEQGHLKLPPLEKQFLISPPSSPPVGWTQSAEMAPVICDFDLMSRLASFTVDDKYELYSGEKGQPAIIVTPCTLPSNNQVYDNIDQTTSFLPGLTRKLPQTPRPPD